MKRFFRCNQRTNFTPVRFRHVALVLCLSALAAFTALIFASRFTAFAAPESSARVHSGSVGITMGQTVRLSVANTTNAAIKVSMVIYDDQGKVLVQCNGVSVEGGETYWMDLNGDKVANEQPARLQVRAQVQVKGIVGPDVLPRLHPTLQVFDNASGKTTFLYSEFMP